MMEHTTDRMFWTLTSIIVAALLLTLGINTFPKATQSTLQTFSGMTKQADMANAHVANAASDAINDTNGQSDGLSNNQASNSGSTTNTNGNNSSNNNNTVNNKQASEPLNNLGQTTEQAIAAAPVIPLFDTIDHKTGIGYTITGNEWGSGYVLHGISFPQGFNQSTFYVPEYIKTHNMTNGDDYLLHVTQVDSTSNFGLSGDTSKLTKIVLPSTVTAINGGFFDMTSQNYNGQLSNNLIVAAPRNSNFAQATQKPAISEGDSKNGVSINFEGY